MTKLKKFTSVFVAMMMVLMMSIGVFAKANPTITITNASGEYDLYKIFDVEIDTEGNATYYISNDSNNPWYTAAKDAKISNTNPAENLFTLKSDNDTRDRVYVNGTESDITKFVKGVIAAGGVAADIPEEPATDGTVVFSVDYGYYYVSTHTGSLVCITYVDDDVVISDKSTSPSWDPSTPSSPDPNENVNEYGKYIKDTEEDSTWGKETNAAMGDVQYFMVNAYVPSNNMGMAIYEYTITDTLDSGFTNVDNITAEITDGTFTNKIPLDDDCITTTGNDDGTTTITVVFKVKGFDGYPEDAHISIQYVADVDTDAVIENENNATLTWTQYDPNGQDPDADATTNPPVKPQKPSDPDDPESTPVDDFPPVSTTTTYVYGLVIKKIDAETQDVINGAEFTLVRDDDTEIKVVKISDATDTKPAMYRAAKSGESTTDIITAGEIDIFGLDGGYKYILTETKAPEGYNKLAAPIEDIVIDNDSTHADDAHKVVVENSKGIELPSTGGIGTRVFYVTGAVVMLGAVVLLVAKKRTSDK